MGSLLSKLPRYDFNVDEPSWFGFSDSWTVVAEEHQAEAVPETNANETQIKDRAVGANFLVGKQSNDKITSNLRDVEKSERNELTSRDDNNTHIHGKRRPEQGVSEKNIVVESGDKLAQEEASLNVGERNYQTFHQTIHNTDNIVQEDENKIYSESDARKNQTRTEIFQESDSDVTGKQMHEIHDETSSLNDTANTDNDKTHVRKTLSGEETIEQYVLDKVSRSNVRNDDSKTQTQYKTSLEKENGDSGNIRKQTRNEMCSETLDPERKRLGLPLSQTNMESRSGRIDDSQLLNTTKAQPAFVNEERANAHRHGDYMVQVGDIMQKTDLSTVSETTDGTSNSNWFVEKIKNVVIASKYLLEADKYDGGGGGDQGQVQKTQKKDVLDDIHNKDENNDDEDEDDDVDDDDDDDDDYEEEEEEEEDDDENDVNDIDNSNGNDFDYKKSEKKEGITKTEHAKWEAEKQKDVKQSEEKEPFNFLANARTPQIIALDKGDCAKDVKELKVQDLITGPVSKSENVRNNSTKIGDNATGKAAEQANHNANVQKSIPQRLTNAEIMTTGKGKENQVGAQRKECYGSQQYDIVVETAIPAKITHVVDIGKNSDRTLDIIVQTETPAKSKYAADNGNGVKNNLDNKGAMSSEEDKEDSQVTNNDEDTNDENEELQELFKGSMLTEKEEMKKINLKYRGYGEGLGDVLSVDFETGKLKLGLSDNEDTGLKDDLNKEEENGSFDTLESVSSMSDYFLTDEYTGPTKSSNPHEVTHNDSRILKDQIYKEDCLPSNSTIAHSGHKNEKGSVGKDDSYWILGRHDEEESSTRSGSKVTAEHVQTIHFYDYEAKEKKLGKEYADRKIQSNEDLDYFQNKSSRQKNMMYEVDGNGRFRNKTNSFHLDNYNYFSYDETDTKTMVKATNHTESKDIKSSSWYLDNPGLYNEAYEEYVRENRSNSGKDMLYYSSSCFSQPCRENPREATSQDVEKTEEISISSNIYADELPGSLGGYGAPRLQQTKVQSSPQNSEYALFASTAHNSRDSSYNSFEKHPFTFYTSNAPFDSGKQQLLDTEDYHLPFPSSCDEMKSPRLRKAPYVKGFQYSPLSNMHFTGNDVTAKHYYSEEPSEAGGQKNENADVIYKQDYRKRDVTSGNSDDAYCTYDEIPHHDQNNI